jgi:hypothetical protein
MIKPTNRVDGWVLPSRMTLHFLPMSRPDGCLRTHRSSVRTQQGIVAERRSSSHPPSARDLLLPRGFFDVLDDPFQVFQELLLVVPNPIQVRADPSREPGGPACFLDLLVAQSIQRQLRCVEGASILTVGGRSRAKGHQDLL